MAGVVQQVSKGYHIAGGHDGLDRQVLDDLQSCHCSELLPQQGQSGRHCRCCTEKIREARDSSGVSPGKACTQGYQQVAAAVVLSNAAPAAGRVIGNGGLIQAADRVVLGEGAAEVDSAVEGKRGLCEIEAAQLLVDGSPRVPCRREAHLSGRESDAEMAGAGGSAWEGHTDHAALLCKRGQSSAS